MMKHILVIVAFCFVSFFSVATSALNSPEPIISHNVTVLPNATPSQCPSSWNGQGGEDINTTDSGRGQSNYSAGTAVLSCSDCSIQNGSCVCGTCYNYNN